MYCGEQRLPDELTLDHVQARMRGGDRSGGNLVTACNECNARKGHQRLAEYLAADSAARAHFFRHARHVWPRHLRAVEEEIAKLARRSPVRRSRSP